MPKLPSLKDNATLGDLFALFPAQGPALMPFIDSVLRGPGVWDIADRELIAAYVSSLNACQYCIGSHLIFAEAFGIPKDQLEATLEDPSTAGLNPGLAATLTYLRALNTLPHRLAQADMDVVLETGVSEQALYEAITVAALFSMMNRIVEGTGVSFDAGGDPMNTGLASYGGHPRAHRFVPVPQKD